VTCIPFFDGIGITVLPLVGEDDKRLQTRAVVL
jgi:hypothetical protein